MSQCVQIFMYVSHTHTTVRSSIAVLSCSSSDDEIKEAFECPPPHSKPLPAVPVYRSQIWSAFKDVKETQTSFPWNSNPFVESNRPLKVVPVGHRKPKFFAQMSTNYNERPSLDFNKMQHSKRLVMVRV